MSFPNYATVPNGDDFNRADENPLAGNWAAYGGAGLAGLLKIVSNQMKSAGAPTDYVGMFWKREVYRDPEFFVKVAVQENTIGKFLKVRGASPITGKYPPEDPAQNGYQISVDEQLSDEWRLTRIDNGVHTEIATVVTGIAIGNGDSIGIDAVGSTITAYRRVAAGAWVPIITANDTTYKTGFTGYVTNGDTVLIEEVGIGGLTVGWADPTRRLRWRRHQLRR